MASQIQLATSFYKEHSSGRSFTYCLSRFRTDTAVEEVGRDATVRKVSSICSLSSYGISLPSPASSSLPIIQAGCSTLMRTSWYFFVCLLPGYCGQTKLTLSQVTTTHRILCVFTHILFCRIYCQYLLFSIKLLVLRSPDF